MEISLPKEQSVRIMAPQIEPGRRNIQQGEVDVGRGKTLGKGKAAFSSRPVAEWAGKRARKVPSEFCQHAPTFLHPWSFRRESFYRKCAQPSGFPFHPKR